MMFFEFFNSCGRYFVSGKGYPFSGKGYLFFNGVIFSSAQWLPDDPPPAPSMNVNCRLTVPT